MVGDHDDSVAATVEMRDRYTARHQARVAVIAVAIARRLGLDEESCRGLSIAGRMHDVGKMAIPMDILSKPGPLLPAEYELVKLHPTLGAAVIARIDFPWPVATMIRQHHERLDGSGYPDGLGGADLLPESRILAVADVAEASASHRPYRPGFGSAGALEIIREASRRGTLDETAVNACIELVLSGEIEFEQ
jgi:HD-GYP domain-containing protein (c-di-GMP phosphodiesterase class II)